MPFEFLLDCRLGVRGSEAKPEREGSVSVVRRSAGAAPLCRGYTMSSRSELVLDLFTQYSQRVRCFARQRVDSDTADDVCQDVFASLLTLEGLEEKDVTISYLLKSAENQIRRRVMKCRRERALPGRDAMHPDQSPSSGCDSAHAEIEIPPGRLSDHEADALRLLVCEELSYRDAAASLNVKVTTLNNWKARAIRKLKDAFEGVPCSLAS